MKIRLIAGSILFCGAALLSAQGPGGRGPGGPGPGGPGGPFGGRGMGILGGRVVTGAPYSATEVQTFQEKFADGNSVNTTRTTAHARDGQGRTYTDETVTPAAATGKAAYHLITITDPVAGYRYELNSSTMIAMQSRMPTPPAGKTGTAPTPPAPTAGTVTRPDGSTITTTILGPSTINGVAATGTQIVEVIPAGAIGNAQAITITRTNWISTDLKLPVQIKSNDPRGGSSDMELTNIVLAEPAATLFAVPSTYTIKKGGPGGFGGGRGPGGATGASGHGRPGPNFRRG